MPNKCIYCGSFDLKEEEDRSKPPISFVPRPIYHKKYTCKKCRKSFSKEDMDNPPPVSGGTDAPPETAPAREPAVAASPGQMAKPASGGFSSDSYVSPGLSSSPATIQRTGFAIADSESGSKPPQEKKSYMQIMKEKQQYQAQQFQSTMAAEQVATKPAAKPAPKPAPSPAGGPVTKPAPKPAGGPVIKPAGAKPPAPAPAVPAAEALPAELPELEALPDLPPVTPPTSDGPQASPGAEEMSTISEFSTPPPDPPAPAFQKVEAPAPPPAPVIKPAFQTVEAAEQQSAPAMKPAGMKPLQKPAGGPVMKPVGMKPPVKPAGGPVMKPPGMKPPAPSAPVPSAFQTIEAPAPKYVPPVPVNEPMVQAAPGIPMPGQAPGSRLQQLLSALDNVLSSLAWPQEKKDMLKQELMNLPDDEQIAFLEQLGVEVSPVKEPAPAPAPVAPIPAAPTVPAPAPVVPIATAPGPNPPVKPAGGMKPPVSPPVQPVVAMKPPVTVPAPVPAPVHPPVKPAGGMKPAIKPPVAVPAQPVTKPAGMKPPVAPASSFAVPGPPTKPPVAPVVKPSAAAVGLFASIDQQIEQTMGGEFDLDKFLDTGLDLAAPGVPPAQVAAPIPRIPAVAPKPAAIDAAENGVAKPAIKLSQISTKVEKKTEEDIKREEERHKAQAATESSLVYMRLLAFEKACSVPKTYKIADFCKILKDIDTQTVADFITAVDNDFIIKYDSDKAQVIVSEISGPEMEILSRQFEKWLRFGRL
ncbi:MAG: hypothetical protein Q6353_001355 [Candidatus Sigynarchaeum springense]